MSVPPHPVTGFVLAGGKSSRMGTDKAELSLDGRTLLEHALTTVRAVCGEALIIGSRTRYGSFGPGYEDIFPDCGPLSGVHSALTHSQTEWNLIIAVDTPFLKPELLRYLIERASAVFDTVVAPKISGIFQPLCAGYLRKFLPNAGGGLKEWEKKQGALVSRQKNFVV